MGYLRLGFVLAVLAVIGACGGDDDASKSKSGAAAGTSAQSSTNAGAGGSGPMLRNPGETTNAGGAGAIAGSLTEGEQCTASNRCVSGLTCIDSGLNGSTTAINICSRGCTSTTQDTDCKSGEQCFVVDSARSSGYCVDLVTTPFKECGPQVTAACDGTLQCAIISNDDPMTPEVELSGFCVQPCAADSGDAGVSMGDCAKGQSCLPVSGGAFCATLVAAGGDCTADGLLCADDNETCFPDDPTMPMPATFSCHQTCEKTTDVCKSGTCTTFTSSDSTKTLKICI